MEQMTSISYYAIRNLIVGSIYLLNPLRITVLNKMKTINYLNGQIYQPVNTQPMYSFVTSQIHKESSTYGSAMFFITMDQKDLIDTYIKYYGIRDQDELFSNFTSGSELSK